MELVVLLIIVVGIIGWWMWKEGKHEETGHPLESITKKMDVNQDGKIDVQDVKSAMVEVKEAVVTTADLNKDGKVDSDDVKVVVEETKKVARKAKAKTTEAVAKVKSAAKKSSEKKSAPKPTKKSKKS